MTALAALTVPSQGLAQRLAPAFPTYSASFERTSGWFSTGTASLAFGHPDDYRWEGALAGGVTLGVLGAALAIGFCGYDGSRSGGCVLPTAEALVFGGAIGAGLGALLGGLIPKH